MSVAPLSDTDVDSFPPVHGPVVVEPSEALVNQRVSQVYAHVAAALGVTTITAVASAKIGFTAIIKSAIVSNPLLGTIGLSAIGIALLAATILTPKENSLQKYGFYGLFAVWEGVFLSPLILLNAPAFVGATAAAAALTGGLGIAAMKLQESFKKYEKILMVGLGAIALASFGSLVLPATPAIVSHKIAYLGGFALFSALTIYDTHEARSEARNLDFDPINRSIDIYLNSLNLLIRFFELFAKK